MLKSSSVVISPVISSASAAICLRTRHIILPDLVAEIDKSVFPQVLLLSRDPLQRACVVLLLLYFIRWNNAVFKCYECDNNEFL